MLERVLAALSSRHAFGLVLGGHGFTVLVSACCRNALLEVRDDKMSSPARCQRAHPSRPSASLRTWNFEKAGEYERDDFD